MFLCVIIPSLVFVSHVRFSHWRLSYYFIPELIPRPARACQDPPLYLRLRMGRPMGKAPPLPTSVMSYGKNKLRPEYWFSIPKNRWVVSVGKKVYGFIKITFLRVDELFRFLNSWVPQLYGELEEWKIKEMGYELIEHDTEWAQGGIQKVRKINCIPRLDD